jgi:Mrp family chromosome partitioning ATPase
VPVLATVHSLPRRLRTVVVGASESRYSDTYEILAANLAQILEGGEYGNGARSDPADRELAVARLQGPADPHEAAADGANGSQRPICLVVTSAIAGEGKTMTAANLAATLARRGERVLLADFDLRKPSVSRLFSIPDEAEGVSEILRGRASVEPTLWEIPLNGAKPESTRTAPVRVVENSRRGVKTASIRQSALGSLRVLPAGHTANDNGLNYFARLPRLLESLPTGADLVIIDTPPALLAAGVAELSQSVDAVLVVVRQGVVSRRRLRALARQAQSWRSKFVGAVLNDSPVDEGYGAAAYYQPTS